MNKESIIFTIMMIILVSAILVVYFLFTNNDICSNTRIKNLTFEQYQKCKELKPYEHK